MELLGKEGLEKFKALIGDKFDAISSLFDKGKEDDTVIDDTTLDETIEDNGENTEDSTQLEGEETESEEELEDEKTEANIVLEEGWLREDGTVDLDKILDEALKGYIEGLNKKISDIDQQMLIDLIKGEAKSEGALDIEDILKFIDISTISRDNVKDTISSLKKDKGYLFKQKEKGNGFNPAQNRGKAKYREGMSFGDALDLAD